MNIIVDMCCEIVRDDKGIVTDLHFENGDRFMNKDFKRFGCTFEVYTCHRTRWPEIILKGTEAQLREYLAYYEWDDIDFILETCEA